MKNQPIRISKSGLACLLAFVLSAVFVQAQTGGVMPSPTPVAVPSPTVSPRLTATGATKLPTPTSLANGRDETMRLPIRKMIGVKDAMLLTHAMNYYTLFVPQSARVSLKSCTLHLEFTNSIALLTERSVLRVVVNDVIVAQFYLDRNKPFHTADIALPLDLLQVGFNRMQFVVAQHYTWQCEDPGAPELFTEINPDKSYLSAVGEFKPIPERLSFLRWWVDEKLWAPYQFNVCIPSAAQMSELQLSWGATVTQGVALALNNENFRVSTANALRPNMDNIVIGTQAELSGFLTSTEMSAINGSFLAIKSLPGDPTHCMIIISGRNEQEVGQTALAFGLVNFPLPDSQYAVVDQMTLPEKPAYIRNAPLNVPGIYSFKKLGYTSRTIRGWHTGGYSLKVYMPGDISKEDPANAELRLHFAYGAALRKDSTFNLFVNRQFQTAIRLSNQEGEMHTDHRVYLPMKAFQPGLNFVDLVPEMVPMITAECELLHDENLLFTLYEDSDFVLPKAMRKARLPSLGLFSQTAFPYSGQPDGADAAMFVTSADPDTVCAAWTLVGKMAQVSGALMHRMEVGFKPPRSKKSLLIVGPRDQIPEEVIAKAPVSPLQVGKMRYLVSVSPKPEKLAASPVEEFLEKIRGVPQERSEPEAPATANLTMVSDLVEDTVAVQYESPFAQGYPVTLITANDPARLLAGMNTLQDRRVWDNFSGDLAVWNTDPDSFAAAKVGGDFIFKSSGIAARVGTSLDSKPWLFAVLLIGVLLLIGLIVRGVLKRREDISE